MAPKSIFSKGNNELIAVITAAIAAYETGKSYSNFKVRKIRRVSGQMTMWLNAGITECMDSRKM